MVPRSDVVTLASGTSLEDALDVFVTYGHSRIPVLGDSPDEVLGVVYAKDLLHVTDEAADWITPLLRVPLEVPASMRLNVLLEQMQSGRTHMAVVYDEYGGVAGLVTLEDILEEIVGEIVDEYDPRDEEPDLRALEDGTYELSARSRVDELNRELRLDLPDTDDFETVGGFLLTPVGTRPPRPASPSTGTATVSPFSKPPPAASAKSASGRPNSPTTPPRPDGTGRAGRAATRSLVARPLHKAKLQTRVSFDTRPVATHSATSTFPSASKQASWGCTKRPAAQRPGSRRSRFPSAPTSARHSGSSPITQTGVLSAPRMVIRLWSSGTRRRSSYVSQFAGSRKPSCVRDVRAVGAEPLQAVVGPVGNDDQFVLPASVDPEPVRQVELAVGLPRRADRGLVRRLLAPAVNVQHVAAVAVGKHEPPVGQEGRVGGHEAVPPPLLLGVARLPSA